MPSRQKDFSKVFADSLKSKNNNVLYQKKYFLYKAIIILPVILFLYVKNFNGHKCFQLC